MFLSGACWCRCAGKCLRERITGMKFAAAALSLRESAITTCPSPKNHSVVVIVRGRRNLREKIDPQSRGLFPVMETLVRLLHPALRDLCLCVYVCVSVCCWIACFFAHLLGLSVSSLLACLRGQGASLFEVRGLRIVLQKCAKLQKLSLLDWRSRRRCVGSMRG